MIKEITRTTTERCCDFCQDPTFNGGTCGICNKDFCSKHGIDYNSDPFVMEESDDDYYEMPSVLCKDCLKLLAPFREKANEIKGECLEKLAEVEQEWHDLKAKLLEKHES